MVVFVVCVAHAGLYWIHHMRIMSTSLAWVMLIETDRLLQEHASLLTVLTPHFFLKAGTHQAGFKELSATKANGVVALCRQHLEQKVALEHTTHGLQQTNTCILCLESLNVRGCLTNIQSYSLFHPEVCAWYWAAQNDQPLASLAKDCPPPGYYVISFVFVFIYILFTVFATIVFKFWTRKI